MGKLMDGIHGHIHGKIGGVVFYTANGQNIARSLPRGTRKKKKPTPLQAFQRERFAVMQQWLKPLLRIIKVGFGNFAPQTGHNAAMSYNLKHALMYNEETSRYEVKPEAFAFSSGTLPTPIAPGVVQDGNLVRFSWTTPNAPQIRYTTRTLLLLYNPDNQSCVHKTYGNAAEDALEISGFNLWGSPCHAYMAFLDEETGAVSDSVYAGSLVLEPTEG